jgi:Mrp family chromosome partitioning ATPase/capsular polysaccharide biosynthesis protein
MMDLLAYLRVLRRRWFVILALTLVGAGIGVASAELASGTSKSRTYYKATHTLVLDTTQDSSSYHSAFTNLDQIAILATTGDVPDRVAKKLATTESGRQLAEHIMTTTNATTSTLDITAAERDPKQAVQLADTFADELVGSLTEKDDARLATTRDTTIARMQSLQNQIANLDAQIGDQPAGKDLLTAQRDSIVNQYRLAYENFQQLAAVSADTTRLTTLQTADAIPITADEYSTRLSRGQLGENNVQVGTNNPSNTALTTSSDSSFKGPVSRGVLGALFGLIAGVGLALVADHLDRRIHTREEAEAAFGLPVLAEVPMLTHAQQRDNNIMARTAPLSRTAEAYRAVRSSLLFQHASTLSTDGLDGGSESGNGSSSSSFFEPPSHGPLVVMVTSAVPKEGKTTTSANLAAVFAEAGSRVLVVNCDFRRPTIHRFFGLDNEPQRVFSTSIPRVRVVTNVLQEQDANPAQAVAAQRHLIRTAPKHFDVIILDTAPLLTANDAAELVSSADLVLLVARPGLTTVDAAQRAIELLDRLHSPLSGVVMVAVDSTPNDYYYYYQRSTARELARSAKRKGSAKATRANGESANLDDAGKLDDPFDSATISRTDETKDSS